MSPFLAKPLAAPKIARLLLSVAPEVKVISRGEAPIKEADNRK